MMKAGVTSACISHGVVVAAGVPIAAGVVELFAVGVTPSITGTVVLVTNGVEVGTNWFVVGVLLPNTNKLLPTIVTATSAPTT
jgi:hypothetical protein